MTCPTCRQKCSPLDTEVLSLKARGLSVEEIAAQVNRHPRTVQRTLERYGAAQKRGRPRKPTVAEKKTT